MSRGRFITLEGVDGAGKSSHLDWLAAFLRERGREVVTTREPGGTPLGEALRTLLLGHPMEIQTETLLVFAARCEHLARVIRPALERGVWVVSDRFTDATYAYQGGGRGLDPDRIACLETWVHAGFQPDLTLVFDVPVEVARERVRAGGADPDRFETMDEEFFNRVRVAYRARAEQFPDRIKLVDSGQYIAAIRAELENIIASL